MTWDPEQGNLMLDPVFAGPRRMKLYIHLEPKGPDVDVQMFALVETMSGSGSDIGWTDPKQDVHLEDDLSRAFVAALKEKQEATP
jgi:hypothetical protein